MIILPFLLSFLVGIQVDAPFKPKDDFEIKFELTFKQRSHDEKAIYMDETRADREKRNISSPLPYLKLFVKVNQIQAKEIKLKVIRDDKTNMLSKKTAQGMEFKLDLGFTDDIKDRISGYKHVIQFLSSDKEVLSRILIEFDKDGNYFVNGEKRGKV